MNVQWMIWSEPIGGVLTRIAEAYAPAMADDQDAITSEIKAIQNSIERLQMLLER